MNAPRTRWRVAARMYRIARRSALASNHRPALLTRELPTLALAMHPRWIIDGWLALAQDVIDGMLVCYRDGERVRRG